MLRAQHSKQAAVGNWSCLPRYAASTRLRCNAKTMDSFDACYVEFLRKILRSGVMTREAAQAAMRYHEAANYHFAVPVLDQYIISAKPDLPEDQKQEVLELLANAKDHKSVQALVAEGRVSAEEINTLLSCTAPEALAEWFSLAAKEKPWEPETSIAESS